MKYKYNKNLDLFIRHSKTLSDCRVKLVVPLLRTKDEI